MSLQQISASAGSGKTYTLTRLFLDRLTVAAGTSTKKVCLTAEGSGSGASSYALSEILAATFTNKAADEMKTRVIQSLKASVLETRALASPPAGAAQSAARFDQWLSSIFRHYSSLNIRTIDSLLHQLVRLSALQLGLPPQFTPSFSQDDYLDPIYDALVADIGAYLRGDIAPDDPVFLVHTGDRLAGSLMSAFKSLILQNTIKGFSKVAPVQDSVYTLVEHLLSGKTLVNAEEEQLRAIMRTEYMAVNTATKALNTLLLKEQLEVSAYFKRAIADVLATKMYDPLSTSTMLDKETLDECLNKKSKGAASPETLKAHADFRAAVVRFRKNVPLLKMALRHAPLIPLAEEIHCRIRAFMHETAILPAPCIPVLAQQLLSGDMGVSEALCRMGTRLTHLLLDEFQDTSILQWQAILPLAEECLSRGGSLTYVGDVKQAIYGWRGGEVSLFASALEEPSLRAMLPALPKKDNLPFNWRSAKEVVWHNNAFFSLLQTPVIAHEVMRAMLPKDTPESYVIEASTQLVSMYTGGSQQLPDRALEDATPTGQVCLYSIADVNKETLHAILKQRLRPLFADLATRWQWGDMAVLVRVGDEERFVASCLTEWGIPVITANSFLLSEHPLVLRLVSFLRFIDYPFNDLAFWEFVSGGECFGRASGLDCRSLENWLAKHRAKRKARQETPPLYTVFRKDFPLEWETLIVPFYSQAGLMSSYDLLMEIIGHYQLFKHMPDQKPFLLRLLEIAHLAEKQGFSSLSAFLEFWDKCKADEKLPLPEGMNAVRIMTIFSAKGLEFPVVIAPFHHHGKQRDNGLVVTEIDGTAMMTEDSPMLPETYYPARITECLEHLNLVYVSWTRPVHELHAFITLPKRATAVSKGMEVLLRHYQELVATEHPPLGAPICTFEDLTPVATAPDDFDTVSAGYDTEDEDDLPDASPACGAFANVFSTANPEHRGESSDSPPVLPDAGLIPMQWLPRLKIYRTAGDETQFSARQRGNLAHLCLEYLTLHSSKTREQDVERAIFLGFQNFPLPIPDAEQHKHALKAALLWFASLPDAPFWLVQAEKEQAILDEAGNMHRVDALVEFDDHLLVIDYKTGKMPPDPSQPAPPEGPLPDGEMPLTGHEENHFSQVRRYMRLLIAAQGKPVKGLLVYLDCRLTQEVYL